MLKGLCVCYTVIIITYFSVGISGYWAFGNQVEATILSNFMGINNPLLPTWFLLLTNIFAILQLSAVTVVTFLYNQLCWLFQLLHSCMHDDRWYFHHIYIGILATEQWSVWAEVWGSNSRWILDPKCYPPSPISVSICVVGNVVGSNVSLLRWHHGLVWGIWMYSTRFSIAHCLVQCGLEPFKEIHHLLGKYFDYRGVLISSRLWSDCIR